MALWIVRTLDVCRCEFISGLLYQHGLVTFCHDLVYYSQFSMGVTDTLNRIQPFSWASFASPRAQHAIKFAWSECNAATQTGSSAAEQAPIVSWSEGQGQTSQDKGVQDPV